MHRNVLRLAFIEYFLPFRRMRPPGGRDFLWLTLLLVLIQCLTLLLMSTQRGVLDRAVDTFLGYEPDYGVPIWVSRTLIREADKSIGFFHEGTFRELAGETSASASGDVAGAAMKLHLDVYRNMEADRFFRMPVPVGAEYGDPSSPWTNKAEEIHAPFEGWAVSTSGAIWPGSSRYQSWYHKGPWKIVLNRRLFEGPHFSMQRYRAALKGRLPPDDFAAIEAVGDSPVALEEMWFDLQMFREHRLTKFKVEWAESLGFGAPLAFLFPLELLNAMKQAASHPNICLFPEHGFQRHERIRVMTKLRIGARTPHKTKTLNTLAGMVGGKVASNGPRLTMTVSGESSYQRGRRCDPGWDAEFVDRAMKAFDLDLKVAEIVKGDLVRASVFDIEMPCNLMSPTMLSELKESKVGDLTTGTAEDSGCRIKYPIADKKSGYSYGLVYVSDRNEIEQAVERIEGVENGIMTVAPVYQDALDRFSFLSALIETLNTPYAVFLLTFLGLITMVQIGTVIGHRQGRYGLMIARGLSTGDLRIMVSAQMFLAVFLSIVFAVLLVYSMRFHVNAEALLLSQAFPEVTKARQVDLLPIQWLQVLIVWGIALVLVFLIAIIHLWLIGIRRQPEIEQLIKETS